MERLCGALSYMPFGSIILTTETDEVLQLVFYELTDPGPLTLVSRRFHTFSQDPYIRANYFLIYYGPIEAMYYALGRGKLLNERVLDVRVFFLATLATISEISHPTACTDSIGKRSAAFPLPLSNSSTSLLSYAVSFHQDAVGEERLSTCLPLLHEDRGREVR